MLRNRTRTVTTKQALMADHTPVSSSSPVSRFNNGYFPKKPSQIETITPSPTSILDTQQFFPISNPHPSFGNDHIIISRNPNIFPKNKSNWKTENPKRLGLALIDSLDEKIENKFSKPLSRKVLLKIEIPQTEPKNSESKSPGDFGTKTRNSPFWKSQSPFGKSTINSPKVFNISTTEMELSEEYTRVIAHGPSPRTIHIYDDCVLESCNGVVRLSELKLERQLSLPIPVRSNLGLDNFLSFCSSCKKRLDHGKDIYIYRGEKGFCSHECRFKEMLSDGEDDLK